MTVIHAIFKNGVFTPTEPVYLPESTPVEVHAPNLPAGDDATLDALYAILSERYHSGRHDLAARHNDHQP
jgi:predicted DNA-binding antitoxin AbrB/MazE fold protein